MLDLAEAVRIVVHRGRIMQEATGQGRMASVALTEAEADEVVRPFGERLSVAAINAPQSVVLSGAPDALDAALADLLKRGVSHQHLPVRYAFHSAQMAPFQQRLARELSEIPSVPAIAAVYSTVTGALASTVAFDSDYFGRNVRDSVRLASALGAMIDDGYDVFVEVGPHPVLASSIGECVSAADRAATIVASLRRGKPERETMLQAAAGLYSAGCTPAWNALQPGSGSVVRCQPIHGSVAGSGYGRVRAANQSYRCRDPSAAGHASPGRRRKVFVWQGDSRSAGPWMADHRIFGRIVLPATAALDLFFAAAVAAFESEWVALTGFSIARPFFIPDAENGVARWQVVATRNLANQADLELFEETSSRGGWRTVATASAHPSGADERPPIVAELPAHVSLSGPQIYGRFRELGAEFGPTFQRLRDVRCAAGAAEGWIETAGGTESVRDFATMHPGLLDAALQLCSFAAGPGPTGEMPARLLLPLGADRFSRYRESARLMRARAQVRESGPGSLCVDVTVEAADGVEIARLGGLRFAEARSAWFAAPADSLYDLKWRPADPAVPPVDSASGRWLIFTDRSGCGDVLQRELAESGARVCRVFAGRAFVKTSNDEFTIDPAAPADFHRLLSEGGWSAATPLQNVVHLWALGTAAARPEADTDGDELLAYGSALHMLQSLVGSMAADGTVWLVSHGAHVVSGAEDGRSLNPRAAGLWGLATVAAVEHPEIRVRSLDLDCRPAIEQMPELVRELRTPAPSIGSALRGGRRWVPELARFTSAPPAPAGNAARRLHLARPGTLDGVELVPAVALALRPTDVRVRVLAAGVNFRDVLVTLGMYPGAAPPLGAECSGVVVDVGAAVTEFRRGDRIVGFAPGSMATELTVPAAFVAPLPSAMRSEIAAGLPVAFLTAHYGLHHLAQLRPGERILIHAAAGGVGIAAVQLAQRCGAEIFATAGSPAKREWLRAHGVQHVMDSRSLAFVDEVAAATHGEGVHVVLNSLAGDFIHASLRTLGRDGRFLELGKRDILTVDEAASLRPDVRYFAYDLGAEAHADPALIRPMLDEILNGIADRSLFPLPVTPFPLSDAADAFRHLAQARHIGKIVLRVAADDEAFVTSAATYWVTGGFGALGLETARWLVRAGARSLVLSGRRPPSPDMVQQISALERESVNVRVWQGDVSDPRHVEQVLEDVAASMPPLRGIVHAAGAVRDAVLVRQQWSDCREVLRGKVRGAFLLHEMTRSLPLDFFVLYSAAGALLGAAGQGVYPAANVELDALARMRHALGLPALSVAWGMWGDKGMAAAERGHDVWAARGLSAIAPELGFACLERLLRERAPYGVVLAVDWARFLARLPEGLDRDFFRGVAPSARPASFANASPSGSPLADRLAVMPAAQRRQTVVAHVGTCVRQVLGLDETTLVPDREPLKDLGLDSLTAMELRNTLVRSMQKALPATLLFDYPTPDQLTGYLMRALGYERAPSEPESDRGRASTIASTRAPWPRSRMTTRRRN